MTYTLSDTALSINGHLSLADCVSLLDEFRSGVDKHKWALADMLAYADDRHHDDLPQFLDGINWTEKTIWSYINTSRKIAPHIRRKGISFSNHSELATDKLTDEQRTYALDKMQAGDWNRADLRDWKRDVIGKPKPSEITITLQWDGKVARLNDTIALSFVAPDDKYVIKHIQAIVIERPAMQEVEQVA